MWDKGWQIRSELIPSQLSSALASILLGMDGRCVGDGGMAMGVEKDMLDGNRVKESGNFGASSWVPGARELLRLPISSSR